MAWASISYDDKAAVCRMPTDVEQQGNNFARTRKKKFFRHGTVAGCQLLSNDIKFKTGIDLINSMQFLKLKHH